MATKALPCPTVLRQLLRYEPETGKLFWLPRGIAWFQDGKYSAQRSMMTWNAVNANKEAFTGLSAGYRQGCVRYAKFQAHRVIWKMTYGFDPDEVDHINGVRDDNRIENLRNATSSENSINRRIQDNNTSGYKGVAWDKAKGKWVAYIKVNRSRKHLGRYCCPKEAYAAYCEAAKRLHGEFGRKS